MLKHSSVTRVLKLAHIFVKLICVCTINYDNLVRLKVTEQKTR